MRMPWVALLLALHACFFEPLSGAAGQNAYRRIPQLNLGVFACAANPAYRLFSSHADLVAAVEALAPDAAPPCAALKARFLKGLEDASIRWEEESLVVVEEYYGTGMATARLDLTATTPGVVDAAIVWKVPPPPVTPDTVVYRFAFVVNRSAVRTVVVTGRTPGKTVIPVPR